MIPSGWRLVGDIGRVRELARFLAQHTGMAEKLVLAEMLLCSHFDQLVELPGRAIVGWLRAPSENLVGIRAGEQSAFSTPTLMGVGDLIQVVDLWAPTLGLRATRWLTRVNGVKVVCGWLDGRWREVRCRG